MRHTKRIHTFLRHAVRMAAVFIAVTSVSVIIFRFYREDSISGTASVRRRIRAELARVSPETAYAHAKLMYPSAPEYAVSAHAAMHIYGEEIYRKYQTEGVRYCDESFVYGCYHGLFSQAIQRKGIDIVPSLFAACKSRGRNTLACEHGIGHGIVDTLGTDRLADALTICRNSGARTIPFGCMGGVFMEYNFPAFSQNGTTGIRRWDETHPYSPCEDLPGEYYRTCIFRLTEWWEQVLGADYGRIGRLCDGVLGDETKRFCFIAVGSALTVTRGYDANLSRSLCLTMPETQSQDDCAAGAIWEFTRQKKSVEPTQICQAQDTHVLRCAGSVEIVRGWIGEMISD